MKAIVHDRYGTADVLHVAEIDRPEPRQGEVLIRVRAAGVDRGVVHLVSGLPYLVRLGFGLRGPRTRVRGMDVAGVVEAVGPGVTRFRPGEEVFGVCAGAFAEYARARQDRLVPKPAGLTFEQAAAVPVSGTTALQGVGTLQEGQRVLVLGAGGGVGTFAVQVAKAAGGRVTGVCGPGKADLVRSLGAEQVVDYTTQEVEGRYDVVLDIAGDRPLSRLRRLLVPGGRLVIVGSEKGGRLLSGMHRQFGAMLLAPFVRDRIRMLVSLVREDDLRRLAELLESGQVTPVVGRTYPLDEAPDAVRYVAGSHALGKVVLTV
ncbi:NAD(P)-dependent alcohol dehydrogenase [Nonomuraea sediminis]|uniref:NAD(P)-dependent alcohol dehydrogenase n=1 Tax=Nonomuraea sediminis TaxID=2835864 RepID=UPI001BDDA788|nr:NAD(P)-dependent alcohol dehydrogenase [Nonomuraea sediminis]